MDRSRGYSLTQHPDPELYCLGHLDEEFDFHAGAKGIDDKGQGEVEDVTRRMVKLEVPAWREPLPAAVAAAGEGAAEVPAFAPLYAVYAPVKREPATATLIPYFAWANRGENEMTVWLRG